MRPFPIPGKWPKALISRVNSFYFVLPFPPKVHPLKRWNEASGEYFVSNNEDFSQLLELGFMSVPKVWKYMLPDDFLYFQIPHEKRATCNNCPNQCNPEFHPNYRCCTYNPRIPNYLLGMALEDPKTAPLIEDMIAEGFATPEGMIHTPPQHVDSLKQYSNNDHGGQCLGFDP